VKRDFLGLFFVPGILFWIVSSFVGFYEKKLLKKKY
jgi:hypothetical protein